MTLRPYNLITQQVERMRNLNYINNVYRYKFTK